MSQFDFFDPMKTPAMIDHRERVDREHAERCRLAKLEYEIHQQIKGPLVDLGIWGYPSLIRNPEGKGWPEPVADDMQWYREKYKVWPGFLHINAEPEPHVIVIAYPGYEEAPGIILARDTIAKVYPCHIETKSDGTWYRYY